MKGLDWQLIAFMTVSLFHDHWVYSKLPKLYFYDAINTVQKEEDREF